MILSDQYPGINSKEFKKFLNNNGIPIIFTAINSPFSNGLNERLNQTLVNKIRCKMNETEKKSVWTTVAQICTEKYNETEHTVTGFAPKYLLQGKNLSILPHELKEVGDLVFVENGNRLNRKKLDELKIRPFQIIDKMSQSIYKIDTGHKKSESNLYHITKLTSILSGNTQKETIETHIIGVADTVRTIDF
ncbi:uncharacterized protein LOC113464661 [Ceratina calcarata]|uniref:Uncharacterized protein LOC113464661 n=1 Tax=Ceratina calcarata TaxID=156304 RepID=A0AAJ7S4Z0_9HYME|nr:uncharacterized protein LOC113464661 [Ceratina calcarata]